MTGRDDVQDRFRRAHTLHTMQSAAQEAIVLALRQVAPSAAG